MVKLLGYYGIKVLVSLSDDIFEETTKVLKEKYLKNRHEFDSKRAKLAKRNNKLYPSFVKNQKKLIRK